MFDSWACCWVRNPCGPRAPQRNGAPSFISGLFIRPSTELELVHASQRGGAHEGAASPKYRPASITHTFYVAVAIGGIEREPTSHEDFANLARLTGQQASYEVNQISYTQKSVLKQGQWCIRVESLDSVRGAPVEPTAELRMVIKGCRCLHPAFPKTTVDFFFSERGRKDELRPDLYEEAEVFLRGVRIDVAPDTPAV